MNGRFYLFFVILASLIVAACGTRKEEAHDHGHARGDYDVGAWKEMDEFHAIMAEAFHPYMDSSNLGPAKKRASALMAAADQWASAALPEKVDNEKVWSRLKKLKSEAAALQEQVQTGDDNAIGEQLTRLHDTFHELQEIWYGGH